MNKQEYLTITLSRLDALSNDLIFKNNLSQVRARAIQEEHTPEQSITDFTFDPERIWHYCDYIFSESSLLLLEGRGEESALLRQVKAAAQAFEFLAKFAGENDKQILSLNSAMCYHIAGYQANASCLTKSIEAEREHLELEKNPLLNLDSFLINSFLNSLLKFLNGDVAILQRVSAESLASISAIQEPIITSISDGSNGVDSIFEITAHAYFQQGLSKFVQFSLNGNPQDLSASYENLSKSFQYFEKIGDVILATITSELRVVLNMFRERSTWLNISQYAEKFLTNKIWRFYLRNLALEKSIVEFWPAQLKAIHNNLLTSEDGFVVQMPTSAGKTFIAELAILSALTLHPQSRCLYIAPYRALGEFGKIIKCFED